MSSLQQPASLPLSPTYESLYVQLPLLDDILHDGSDLARYQYDINDLTNALEQLELSSYGHDYHLRSCLASLLRQIESQSRLLSTTASSLTDSERSRTLLEKEVSHLLGAVRSLGARLRTGACTTGDAEVANMLEEQITLKGEVIKFKDLVAELQLTIARLKTRHDAEKTADEEHIQLLYKDIAVKDQRIQDLEEWQIWWEEAMQRRDNNKDEEIKQLHLQLEVYCGSNENVDII